MLLAGRLHDLGKDSLLFAGKDIPMRMIPLSYPHAAAFTLLGFQRIIDRERYNVVLNRSRCHLKRSCYQNAPSFAYVIGDYTVSKTGTVSGPANEALMAALNAKGFIIE